MTAKWDALDIALLETMIHQGKSSKEIAEALGEGVTPEVVRQQAHRRGFKRPTVLQRAGKAVRDPDDLATLLKAYAPSIEERAQDAPLLLQERLAAYAGDPLAFLADFAPLKLLPYQEAMVRAIHDHPYTLLLCGRGVGKSTLASWYAVWYAFSHPGATILLIGSIERQAAIDFEFCRSFIQSNPLLSSSLVEFSQSFIRLTNNAKLYCLPAGDRGDTIRGFHADLILLDEAARCGEEVFAAVLPMLGAMVNPRFVMCTTPRGMQGFVFNASTNPLWHTLRIRASESSLLTPAYLEDMKRTMPHELYEMEFEANFIDESTSAFPFSLLDEAEDPDLECDTFP